jgi:phthalate 4,5-cis-dihydrodiol dehydrogenase
MKKLRIAVAGLGRAFSLMSPAFRQDPRVALVAGADSLPAARERFRREFGCKSFADVEELCRQEFDVLYVASPHPLHAAHAQLAFAAGKHALVEKPMALALQDCQAMVDAAKAAGRVLIVGPSHSFDLPIVHTRKITAQYGKVRMITALNFTDFMSRRRREAPDNALTNQAPHQVDIVRLLAASRVTSVRTQADDRAGSYSCLLAFENGAGATLAYSGYGRFPSNDWMDGISELGKAGIAHEHFGLFIVSCENADLRPLPTGVMVYGDGEPRLEPLPPPRIPRVEVIDELYAAIIEGKRPLHDGEWGMETMKVCLAMQRSAREGKEIAP